MKSLVLVTFWAMVASCLFAQEKVVVKKVKSTDKVVTVDVSKASDSERTVKIVTDDNGEESVIEWTDNGEIPDDVRKKLEDAGIDVKMIEGGDGNEVMITVDGDGHGEHEVHKEVIMIKKEGDDGEVMEFQWDGEGEMPEDMKSLLQEHDIELDELHEAHGKGKHKMKMKKMHKAKDKHRAKRHKALKDGRQMNKKNVEKFKIVTIDEDGNEFVNEWTEDGAHKDGNVFHLDGGEGHQMIKRKGGNVMFFSDDKDHHVSDAYMGAQIEDGEDGGARILDLMKDSPADKAGLQKGDVIHRVNGARARSMDGLLQLLNFFDPNDQVELIVKRNGSDKKIKLTLGERPDAYK